MTQFKDKAKRHAENINAGLYTYPVLMAADILLYQTDLVPVGEDQKQHLELTRDLAQRFNNRFGPTFKVPEPYIPPTGARIMSLQEPTKKMSKSDSNPNNYLALLDPPDVIRRKIKRAVTDSGREIVYDPQNKPGLANLLNIYAALAQEDMDRVVEQFQGKGYADLKKELADLVIAVLEPFQERYREIRADKKGLEEILQKGAAEAQYLARRTLRKVYRKIGFVPAS